ncbi:hypothetical protein BS50DRAFT_589845 [Corynespora cassiicola Philippines]|uniref:Uncharacterized protein n=1 Tax=Corynespora cassiicola Philippines TaxID=1448308 RepID=A0A2T2NJ28_CORCC|nr:hypothetical protein BS50DRAFT_589845 [Corynespora cassiicola Philippines]
MNMHVKAHLDPSKDEQDEIFRIANTVALAFALKFHWSSWASWWRVRQFKYTPDDFPAHFWHSMRPFGSCLGVSILLKMILRFCLTSRPYLEKFAECVQLMTTAKTATSENEYHSMVAMCFESYCIGIDHALHPTAFRIRLGGIVELQPYIRLFSEEGQNYYRYDLEVDGSYVLTMGCFEGMGKPFPPLSFAEMRNSEANRKIAIPAALQLEKNSLGKNVPPRKYVSLRSLLDDKPGYIAALPYKGKYLATTCRIQMYFSSRTLIVQLPFFDWLLKNKNVSFHHALVQLPNFTTKGIATAQVKVNLDDLNDDTNKKVANAQLCLLSQLVKQFGAPYWLLSEILISMESVEAEISS